MRRPISLKVYIITLSLLILMLIVTALSARNLRSLNNEVAALSRDQDNCEEQGRGAERPGEKEEGGPGPRAALPFLVLPYLIWNVALPVV